jgi:hypothetical protein
MDSSITSNLERAPECPSTLRLEKPRVEKPRELFPSCSALGECLGKLHDEQREIEREQVERIARLREIADRD